MRALPALGLRAVSALALLLAPAPLLAQPATDRATGSVAQPTTVISTNPIILLAGLFQGELEHRLRNNLAFALGASHVEYEDRYTSVDAKLRLYPQERAPSGLGLATGLGFAHTRKQVYDGVTCMAIGCPAPQPSLRRVTAPSVSIEMHYQWLMGRRQNVSFALGAGMKRYFGDDPFPEVVPTGRLTIGYAFSR